jgi:spore coat protein U-like protein
MHNFTSIFRSAALATALLGAAPAGAGLSGHPVAGGGSHSLGFCSVGTTNVSIANYDGLSHQDAHSVVAWSYACRPIGGATATPQLFTVRDDSSSGGYVHYMSDGSGHRLAYFLCVDPACSMPVGGGTGNLNALVRSSRASAGASISGTMLLYVLVPANQQVPVGNYSDTLTVDVQY